MAISPRARMRMSDFARWIGVSAEYLRERRAEGRVVGERVGRSYIVDVAATLPRLGRAVPEGLGDDPQMAEAVASVAARREVVAVPEVVAAIGAVEVPAAQPRRSRPRRPQPLAIEPEGMPSPPAPSDAEVSYHSERSLHERARRQLSELRLAEARRELIAAPLVRAYCGRAGAMLRERVMAIETAATTQMDAAAHLWLATELREALTWLADGLDREGARLLAGSTAAEASAALEAADPAPAPGPA